MNWSKREEKFWMVQIMAQREALELPEFWLIEMHLQADLTEMSQRSK
jgi:hypothetical protein